MRKPRALKPGQLQTVVIGENYTLDADDWALIGLDPGDPCNSINLYAGLLQEVECLMNTRTEAGDHVTIFHFKGQPHATVPCETEADAHALALLYVLRKSAVT